MTLPETLAYHDRPVSVKQPRAGVPRGRTARRNALVARVELAASVEALVPVGAPIVAARFWDGHLCAGCGRLGEPLTYLTMRWANARGAELRGLRCEPCGPLLDALASVWTGAAPGRVVWLTGPLGVGGE